MAGDTGDQQPTPVSHGEPKKKKPEHSAPSACQPARFPSPHGYREVMPSSKTVPSTPYLSHVNDAHGKGLVAQDCAVLVPLPPLQHDLQFIAISLEKVWVLGKGSIGRQQHDSKAQHSTWLGREFSTSADTQQDLACSKAIASSSKSPLPSKTIPKALEQLTSSISLRCYDPSPPQRLPPSQPAPKAEPAEECCVRKHRERDRVPVVRRSAPAQSPSGRQVGEHIHSISGLASNPTRRSVSAHS